MQLVRQGLNIGRYLGGLLLYFGDVSRELGRIGRALLELCQFNGQQRETLTDIVVKFSGDPATFLLLRLNQLAAHARESRVRQFARRYVEKRNDGTNNLLPFPLRIAPVFCRETRSIGPPQHLVVYVCALPVADRPKYRALLDWEWCPVRARLMN